MALIYHVTTKQEWNNAKEKGFYMALSLETEGFIHCSEAQQVDDVLKRYYRGKTDLLKLVVDTEKLSSEVKYELAPSVNENFPHVYGPINLDAVVEVAEINER
jgi:uncharacterized protein (DUF952 family)